LGVLKSRAAFGGMKKPCGRLADQKEKNITVYYFVEYRAAI